MSCVAPLSLHRIGARFGAVPGLWLCGLRLKVLCVFSSPYHACLYSAVRWGGQGLLLDLCTVGSFWTLRSFPCPTSLAHFIILLAGDALLPPQAKVPTGAESRCFQLLHSARFPGLLPSCPWSTVTGRLFLLPLQDFDSKATQDGSTAGAHPQPFTSLPHCWFWGGLLGNSVLLYWAHSARAPGTNLSKQNELTEFLRKCKYKIAIIILVVITR